MPRALTIRHSIVPAAERRKYLEQVEARRSQYQVVNCRFWVFEDTDLADAFIEFVEAVDVKTLKAALQSASDRVREAARIYQEVEY